MKTVTRLLLVMSFVATAHSASVAQLVWDKDPGPVMTGGAAGSWDYHVFGPVVVYNPDSTRYEMWYGGVKFNSPWEPQIGFATSPDGVTWTRHPEPVLEGDPGAWDQRVQPSSVVREGGSYKMWYTAGNGIGYATSPDGMTWTKYSGNPVLTAGTSAWEADGVGLPSVLAVDGGGYEMWYTGREGSTRSLGYAVSDDGIHWNKADSDNPVLTFGPAGSWDHNSIASDVQRLPHPDLGLAYHMWYVASVDGFFPYYGGWATSTDGIHWTKHDTAVLIPSPELWDQDANEPSSVLLEEDTNTLHMWYDGSRHPTDTYRWRIGHATSVCPSSHCTVVGREDVTIPEDYVLDQNYPNPFNPTTTISYDLPEAADVRLSVYNLLGREIRELASVTQPAGTYEVTFDAAGLPSGVYFYRLQAGDYVETRRMVVVK